MQTVKGRIFVETEYLGANVSCINTEKGLVLVDSPFLPDDARDWGRRIREATGREIAFQINTDHHFDHVLGNGFLTDRIVCHSTAGKGIKFIRNKDELRKIIRGTFAHVVDVFEPEMDALVIPSPMVTFDRSLTLDMGDATIRLEFVGGHSPGTILIHLVEDKVAFTGDNVEGQFPYLGQGHFQSWKETLRKILAMDIDLIVPGHGPVGGKEMAERYLTFFNLLEEEVRGLGTKGVPIQGMAEKSEAIRFFPLEKIAEEGLSTEWVVEQYQTAAKQILGQK